MFHRRKRAKCVSRKTCIAAMGDRGHNAVSSLRIDFTTGKRKVPMWVYLKSKEPFALAGLWDVWRKPDGNRVESFTIVTTEPNELVRPIHNRMPVIIRPEDEERWLDASRTPFVKAQSLLKPYPDELRDAHEVSPIVNSAKYDGPECIRPVSDDERPRGGQLSLL
jgi:putative SOS response-associated peptidase YedK